VKGNSSEMAMSRPCSVPDCKQSCFKGNYCGAHYRQFVQGEEVKAKGAGAGGGSAIGGLDEGKLRMVFKGLDINGDGTLDASELTSAFAKNGQKPALSEVYAMIAQFDTTGKKSVNFSEFLTMVAKVKSGEVPASTGIPSLITGAWEDYIVAVNKKPEKPVPRKVGGGAAQPEAPQGEKYVLKKKKVVYKNAPAKKSFADLP